MAIKFSPLSYPVTITSVTIYAVNNTGSNQYFNIYGYSDLLAETQIFNAVLNNSIPDTGTSPLAITINIPATTITSGSFYIAVGWVTKPLASVSGANTSFYTQIVTWIFLIQAILVHQAQPGRHWKSVSSTAGDLGLVVNY